MKQRQSLNASPLLKQPNNFDLLRLVFAFTVFIHHAVQLSLQPRLKTLTLFFDIDFALESFFIISGFLVFMSFENSSSVREYALKRVRRIYPAYAAVVVISALLGIFLTQLPIMKYLSLDLAAYLSANLCFLNFLQPGLPGVFTSNPITAVNGALWTIRTEVFCYCLVPLIVSVVKKYGRFRVFLTLYLLAFAAKTILSDIASGRNEPLLNAMPYIPWHFLFFLSGGILYFYYEEYKEKTLQFLATSTALYLVYSFAGVHLLKPISLAIIILSVAVFLPYAGSFLKYGDLSYGIYILHFPVLQVMISYGWFKYRPWESLVVATALVAAGSWVSWHLIEKRFLQKNSHYVMSSEKETIREIKPAL